jgi:hypothetical protein
VVRAISTRAEATPLSVKVMLSEPGAFKPAIGCEATHPRRGAKDRGEYRQAAEVFAKARTGLEFIIQPN